MPISQAAYCKNRSTTEHIFATDKTVYLPLLEMSKAFGSMQRNTLIEEPKNVLNQDELHLTQILLDMTISVKCGKYKSQFFSTDTGAPQGRLPKRMWVYFYLAKSFEATIFNDTPSSEEHNTIQINYPLVRSKLRNRYWQTICRWNDQKVEQYQCLEKMQNELLVKLAQQRVKANDSKTKECTIKKTNCHNCWRYCKLDEIVKVFDIFFISESKLGNTFPINPLRVRGYKVFRNDCNCFGGSLKLYINENISYKPLIDHSVCSDLNWWRLNFIKLNINDYFWEFTNQLLKIILNF